MLYRLHNDSMPMVSNNKPTGEESPPVPSIDLFPVISSLCIKCLILSGGLALIRHPAGESLLLKSFVETSGSSDLMASSIFWPILSPES